MKAMKDLISWVVGSFPDPPGTHAPVGVKRAPGDFKYRMGSGYTPSSDTSRERARSLLFPTRITGRSWWGLPARSRRRVSGTLEKLRRSVTEKTMRKASPV